MNIHLHFHVHRAPAPPRASLGCRYCTPLGSAHNLEICPTEPALFWHVDEGGVVGQHDTREPPGPPHACVLFALISTWP